MNLESGGQFGDYQNEIYLGGLSGVLPTMPMAFDVLEARAQAALSPSLLSYVAGGAGTSPPSGPMFRRSCSGGWCRG